MATAAELSLIIKGDSTGAQSALDGLQKKAGSVAGNLGKIGVAGAAGIAGLAAGAGAAALKIGQDFDAAYDGIVATTGATGKQLEGLQASFRNVVANVPANFESASGAIGAFNQKLGFVGPELEDITAQALNLSRATGTDVTANVEAAAGAIKRWGLDAGMGSSLMDDLFAASQASGVGFAELAGQLQAAQPQLAAAGLSASEGAGLLGKLGAAGIDASAVMPGLTKALGAMVKDGIDPAMGIADLFETVKTEGPNSKTAMDTFGKSGIALAKAISDGALSFDDFGTSMVDNVGLINDTAANTDDFGQKMDLLKNKVKLAAEPIGAFAMDTLGSLTDSLLNKVGPALETGGKWLGDFMKGFQSQPDTSFLERLRSGLASIGGDETPPVFVAIRDALADISLIYEERVKPAWDAFKLKLDEVREAVTPWVEKFDEVIGIADTAKAILGVALVGAFGALAIAAGSAAISVIAALAPILIPIAAIGIAVAVLKKAWDNDWGGIHAKVQAVIGWFEANVGPTIDAVVGYVQETIAALKAFWDKHWDDIKLVLETVWAAMKVYVSVTFNALKTIVEVALALIRGDWETAWEKIKTFLFETWEKIKTELVPKLIALGERIREEAEEWKAKLMTKLGELKDKMLEKIQEAVDKFLEKLDIRPELEEKIDDWKAAFTERIETFKEIGHDLVEGIWEGLKEKRDWMVKKVEGWVEDIVAGFKNKFGIRSPSKVMIGIARDVVRGFALGFARAWPSVAKTIKGAVGDMITQVQTMGGGGFGSGFGSGGGWSKWQSFMGGGGWGGGGGIGGGVGAVGNATSGRVDPSMFRTGRGGFLAASSDNYWKQFVAKWGIPEESQARRISKALGLKIPQWLEDMWKGVTPAAGGNLGGPVIPRAPGGGTFNPGDRRSQPWPIGFGGGSPANPGRGWGRPIRDWGAGLGADPRDAFRMRNLPDRGRLRGSPDPFNIGGGGVGFGPPGMSPPTVPRILEAAKSVGQAITTAFGDSLGSTDGWHRERICGEIGQSITKGFGDSLSNPNDWHRERICGEIGGAMAKGFGDALGSPDGWHRERICGEIGQLMAAAFLNAIKNGAASRGDTLAFGGAV